MSDGLVPAYGTTWKIYWPNADEIPTAEDLVEILGCTKVEMHYRSSEVALVTPMTVNE